MIDETTETTVQYFVCGKTRDDIRAQRDSSMMIMGHDIQRVLGKPELESISDARTVIADLGTNRRFANVFFWIEKYTTTTHTIGEVYDA